MNKAGLLAKAPPVFDDHLDILVYSPQKVKDIYGFQYLIKGTPKSIRGSIHKESFLEENPFGRFGGDKSIISTKEQLTLGELVEHNGIIYAVESQVSFNKTMDLKHFELVSLYDYYAEFIVDTQAQANRILGANSSRYLLAMQFDNIPIFPSLFAPNESKYLSFGVYTTKTRSTPYKTSNLLIEQIKQDYAELYAVGLDTNELQKVAYDIFFNAKDYSLAQFPNWEQVNRYDKAFDLKANIYKMDLMINYKITTTQPQNADQLIKKVTWNFKFN